MTTSPAPIALAPATRRRRHRRLHRQLPSWFARLIESWQTSAETLVGRVMDRPMGTVLATGLPLVAQPQAATMADTGTLNITTIQSTTTPALPGPPKLAATARLCMRVAEVVELLGQFDAILISFLGRTWAEKSWVGEDICHDGVLIGKMIVRPDSDSPGLVIVDVHLYDTDPTIAHALYVQMSAYSKRSASRQTGRHDFGRWVIGASTPTTTNSELAPAA